MQIPRWIGDNLILLLAFAQLSVAQAANGERKVFGLDEAISFALQNYPAVRAAMERASAAESGISLAKTNYLPRADALWQGNRASRNNILGLLLPNATIPSVSGPVLSTTSGRGVWGSAAGLLFSWEAFDFGRRSAEVDVARAVGNTAKADLRLTKLDVAIGTVNAYLTLLAAERTVQAAQADVERRAVLAKSVRVLVDNQLRPGADASRANAELARARANLARAQQQQEVSRAALADILAIANGDVEVQEGSLVSNLPEESTPELGIAAHPLAAEQQAQLQQATAELRVLQRSYYPKFTFQSAAYGRGSGANTDGTFAGGTTGLGIDRANWGAGLTVTFPVFDVFSIRHKKAIQAANTSREQARYQQTVLDLTGQLRKAQASLKGARQVAEATPVELEAARETETQTRARYQTGLATIVEVAEAQSLLVQSEIDDLLARLAVWQNTASVAAAQGDLEPFLHLIRRKIQGGP
jgi:outer membrane protein